LAISKAGEWPHTNKEHFRRGGASALPELRLACLYMSAESHGGRDREIRPMESISMLERKKVTRDLGDVRVRNNNVHAKFPGLTDELKLLIYHVASQGYQGWHMVA
jgi:hypothetical protein